MVHLWEKKKNGHPRKLMTLMKTIFWSLTRQTVFLQNLLNHTRLLLSSISDTSKNFFQQTFTFACLLNFYWIVRFAQVVAFSKVAKMEAEVFVALCASQGDFEPSRATIWPHTPCSSIPQLLILLQAYPSVQPYITLSCKQNSLKSIWGRALKLGRLIGDDK